MIERLNAALQGRYRIEREIGSGGMATVYLAHDERHDRRVAVKVLRSELAALVGAERFLTEIRTTAALQHPHILPLFDSGEADGVLFFVMPYVEGDTLRDKLERERQLPIDEAVRIAAEAADALDYAHRQGVLHRDIKPANILLHDGRVMVADFGIALAVRQASSDRLTETGLSPGTPQYMSPEQAAGERSIDARSDVYALGCVLYEMLVGQPPHVGPSAQAVLAKVLTAEVGPVREARRTVPPHVDATVMKALEKLPADRFASAGEFARALRDPATAPVVAAGGGRAGGPGDGAAFPRVSRRMLVASNAILLVVAIGSGIVAFTGSGDDGSGLSSPWVTRLVLDIDLTRAHSEPALSADGRLMAWPTAEGIYVRSFDRLENRLVPGTAGASTPAFSPDGTEIVFARANTLQVVSLEDGVSRQVAADFPVSQTAGPDVWTDDDWIHLSGGIRGSEPGTPRGWHARVNARSGVVERMNLADSTLTFLTADILPDRGHAIGTVVPFGGGTTNLSSEEDLAVGVLDLESGEIAALTAGLAPRYEPITGHVLFIRNSTLMALPFDARRREPTGDTFVVDESVNLFSVARDGTLLAVDGLLFETSPVLLDRRGRPIPGLAGVTDGYEFDDAFFSPGGDRVVMEMRATGEDSTNLWVYSMPDGPLTRLTYDGASFPAWTADGRDILFARVDGIYRVRADATSPPERVLRATGIGWIQATPDGGAVFEQLNDSTFDVGTAPLDGGDRVQLLVSGPANEEDPAVSPDGRWLAYESDESGRRQVYVMPFGQPGRGQQISVSSGNNPFWSHSGEEMFFVNGRESVLEALRVRTDPTFEVLSRETLFSTGRFVGRFQPARGDSVFVAKQEGGPRLETRLVLVRNWIRELEARAEEAGR